MSSSPAVAAMVATRIREPALLPLMLVGLVSTCVAIGLILN
jgi:hypothetical protein